MTRRPWYLLAWPTPAELEAELRSARIAWRYVGRVGLEVRATWWDVRYLDAPSTCVPPECLAVVEMDADSDLAELAQELIRKAERAVQDAGEL
jgi:hypothetical protein